MMRIYVSSASEDNLVPPDSPLGEGFVTYLCKQLNYELSTRGLGSTVWVDAGASSGISLQSIQGPLLMLIVMSGNWLRSEPCRKELQIFSRKFKIDQKELLRSHVILLIKSKVENSTIPELIRPCDRFYMYYMDDNNEKEYRFFSRGKIIHQQKYLECIRKIGWTIWERAQIDCCQDRLRHQCYHLLIKRLVSLTILLCHRRAASAQRPRTR